MLCPGPFGKPAAEPLLPMPLVGQGQPGPGALPGVSKSGTGLETKGTSTPPTST